jgi:hypothetical protein
MGQCRPFSDIDTYLGDLKSLNFFLLDSSFLVSSSDDIHPQYDDGTFLGEKFESSDCKLFVSVTARSEFIDYRRRVVMTETLLGMLSPKSKWKISNAVRKELGSHKGWVDNQPLAGMPPYLSDHRIKECKQIFLPRTQSGQIGWLELCKEYLTNELLKAWTDISEDLSLNYIDMRASDSKKLFPNDLHWQSMYRLAEETALGSQDSMILNLFNSSVIPALVTMDFDLAYGVMASSQDDKVVFVPDNLYRNRLKKLRF